MTETTAQPVMIDITPKAERAPAGKGHKAGALAVLMGVLGYAGGHIGMVNGVIGMEARVPASAVAAVEADIPAAIARAAQQGREEGRKEALAAVERATEEARKIQEQEKRVALSKPEPSLMIIDPVPAKTPPAAKEPVKRRQPRAAAAPASPVPVPTLQPSGLEVAVACIISGKC